MTTVCHPGVFMCHQCMCRPGVYVSPRCM